MPKSQPHWAYDLLTVVLVVAVSSCVFLLLPAQAEAATRADAFRCTTALPSCAQPS